MDIGMKGGIINIKVNVMRILQRRIIDHQDPVVRHYGRVLRVMTELGNIAIGEPLFCVVVWIIIHRRIASVVDETSRLVGDTHGGD